MTTNETPDTDPCKSDRAEAPTADSWFRDPDLEEEDCPSLLPFGALLALLLVILIVATVIK